MKKFLVVLLALVMVFAFASTAMAADTQIPDYSDLDGVPDAQQIAIYRLSALGVLQGSAGWGADYRPAENLTRAEFAKIAIYLTGNEDKVALYAAQASAFADVAEGFWAEGYINAAYDLGLMKGRTVVAPLIFDPQGMVTFQEVATVVLRAVGYDDNLKGEWPNDYSRKAGEVGLIKWVNYVGPKAINRAEMASIANEALDLYMVTYIENEIAQGMGYVMGEGVDLDGYAPWIWYTNEKLGARNAWAWWWNEEEERQDGTPLLAYAFGAWTGTVQFFDGPSDPSTAKHGDKVYSEASGWGYDDFEDGELLFLFGQKLTAQDVATYAKAVEVASDYYIWGGDLVDLGNQLAEITFFFDDDEDWDDIDEVAFVEITSSVERANKVSEDDGKLKADGEKYSFSTAKGDTFVDDFDNAALAYGELFFDSKGKLYDYKEFSTFERAEYEIIESVDENYISYVGGGEQKISKLDDHLIWKDGAFVDWEDLEFGDVVYLTQGLEGDVDLYLAYSPVVGELTDAYTDGVKIDGFKYGLRHVNGSYYSYDAFENDLNVYTSSTHSTLADEFFEEDVTYAVAYAFNTFHYFYIDIVDYSYGVVNSYDWGIRSTTRNQIVGLELFFADGTMEVVDLDTPYTNENNAPNLGSLISYKLDDGEIVTSSIRYREKGVAFTNYPGPVHQFSTSTPDNFGAWSTLAPVVVNENKSTINFNNETYTLADNAVVFLVTSKANGAYNKVKLIDVEDVLEDDFSARKIAAAYTSGVNGLTIKTLYIVDMEGDASYGVGFLTDDGWTSGGNYYVKIDGETNLKVRKDVGNDGFRAALDNAVGALIAYKLVDGEISDFVVVFDQYGIAQSSSVPGWFTVMSSNNTDVASFKLNNTGTTYKLIGGEFVRTFSNAGKEYVELDDVYGFINDDEGTYNIDELKYTADLLEDAAALDIEDDDDVAAGDDLYALFIDTDTVLYVGVGATAPY